MPVALYLFSAVFLAATALTDIAENHEPGSAQQARPHQPIQVLQDAKANILTASETDVLRSGKTERWVF